MDDATGVDSEDADIVMTDVSSPDVHDQNEQSGAEHMENTMDGSAEPQLSENLTEDFSYSNMFTKNSIDTGCNQPPKF